MTDEFYRDTWADIDLDAVHDNVMNMKKRIPPETALMAVVKANGYGHGALQVARTALASGARWLAVALFDEALALRKAGIAAPILVLSPIRPENAELAAERDISLTAFQPQWIKRAVAGNHSDKPIRLHIACDTGMGRIGIRTQSDAAALAEALNGDSRVVVEGMFTHFATADQDDEHYFNEQYDRFAAMIDQLNNLGIHPRVIHCGNSATALRYPAQRRPLYNMVRYGIAMYGLSPSPEMAERLPFPLRSALSLHSVLAHVKKVPAGAFIGYGATYEAPADEWIGTVPIGYADGWLRGLTGSDVLIGGVRCPIVGRICMDQFMCRLPRAFPIGTKVTLIGKDGADDISADELAERLGTINYEITCMIHPRVPRVYWRNGERTECVNPLLL
ncbi:MAG: alanine racemase [Sporolactobacillus sp.]|jgi:alanine racemase|nr:alanine racemase [Sporolactobacillus sp.]